MARPRKNGTEKLSHQIAFRLTEAEYLELRQTALSVGMCPTALVRLLVRKRQQRITIETTTRFDPAYIAQIRAIGHNLNQLVHNAHIFRRVSPKVEALCDDIRKLIFQAVSERIEE